MCWRRQQLGESVYPFLHPPTAECDNNIVNTFLMTMTVVYFITIYHQNIVLTLMSLSRIDIVNKTRSSFKFFIVQFSLLWAITKDAGKVKSQLSSLLSPVEREATSRSRSDWKQSSCTKTVFFLKQRNYLMTENCRARKKRTKSQMFFKNGIFFSFVLFIHRTQQVANGYQRLIVETETHKKESRAVNQQIHSGSCHCFV